LQPHLPFRQCRANGARRGWEKK